MTEHRVEFLITGPGNNEVALLKFYVRVRVIPSTLSRVN